MAAKSEIEWTNATWNPVTGCTKVGPGCDNCYAERFAERFRGVPGHPFEPGFDLTLRPKRLNQPFEWRKPRMIFVNSMSDLFHKKIPKSYVDRVFDTMIAANWHTYQILTKRSSLMRSYINARFGAAGCPKHIWLGTSVEDKNRTSRISHIQKTNAAVRFLSIEPLLGSLGQLDLNDIDWVIVGGESGPNARPMKEEWVLEVRDQCQTFDAAFFFKQWGGYRPKSGGRLLEGREWNEFPPIVHRESAEYVCAAE